MDSGVSVFFDTVFARTFDPDHRLPEGAGYSSRFEFYLGDDAGVDARYAELVVAGADDAGADPGPVRRDGRRPRRARDLAASDEASHAAAPRASTRQGVRRQVSKGDV